jgi:hypothetical protein
MKERGILDGVASCNFDWGWAVHGIMVLHFALDGVASCNFDRRWAVHGIMVLHFALTVAVSSSEISFRPVREFLVMLGIHPGTCFDTMRYAFLFPAIRLFGGTGRRGGECSAHGQEESLLD